MKLSYIYFKCINAGNRRLCSVSSNMQCDLTPIALFNGKVDLDWCLL